jgi:hypothetical protein
VLLAMILFVLLGNMAFKAYRDSRIVVVPEPDIGRAIAQA